MTTSLDRPQRQSPIAIIAGLFNLNALQGLIPIFFVAGTGNRALAAIVLPLALLAVIGLSTLTWTRTTFWIENEELILEKGVLNRSRTQIPLDRIQQIGTEQGLIQQIFNVRRVQVDSAGSVSSELALSAITDEVVAELRARVVGADRVGEAAPPTAALGYSPPPLPGGGTTTAPLPPYPAGLAPPPGTGPTADSTTAPAPRPPAPLAHAAAEDRRTMVMRHEFRDLVELAIARPSTQTVFGLLALSGFGIGGAVEGFLKESITGVVAAVIFAVLAIAAVIAVLIIGTMLREFQLTVWRSDDGLRLTAGLLNKRERIARTQRVQFVRHKQNLMERLFDRTSVYLPQASAGTGDLEGIAAQQFTVPAAHNSKVDEVSDLFLPASRPVPSQHIDRRIIGRLTLLEGIIPACIIIVVGGVLLTLDDVPTWVSLMLFAAAVLIVVQARISAVIHHRNYLWDVDNNVVTVQRGWLNVERTVAATRKVQSIHIRQGLWHRRKGLAKIEFGTAGGSFEIANIPVETARQLRDDILFDVETDSGAWM